MYTNEDILPFLNNINRADAEKIQTIVKILNFIEQENRPLSLNDISYYCSGWNYSQYFGSFLIPFMQWHQFITVADHYGYDGLVDWKVNPKTMWQKEL
jgi:hypothetical protein